MVKALVLLAAALALCAAARAQSPGAATEPEAAAEADVEAEPARAEPRAPLNVTWRGPEPLVAQFRKYLLPPKPEAGAPRGSVLRPWVRDVRRRVPEIAAAEGYFSATVDIAFDDARENATVTVTPGPRTVVDSVDITFKGDLAGEGPEREKRRAKLREGWTLAKGAPFRSADWDVAKTRFEEALVEVDYAAGTLADTRAEVDADTAKAHLVIEADSGPRFTFGDVEIAGIEHYPEAVVRRLVDLRRGERFSSARLLELQHLLQNGPWFASVTAEIEPDPAKPDLVPVKVTVTERPRREIGVSLGYGTDDGARGEAAYRDRDLFDRGLDLQSSLRVSQKRQIGYADVYLPPGLFKLRGADVPFTDSVGVLAEHNTIQNLAMSRFAAAGYRHFTLEKFELRIGLSYQLERDYPQGSDIAIKRALAPIVAITWRHVDNVFDPRRGGVLNMQFAAGAKSLASGDNFVKAYLQYQYWIPLGPMDQILLRTELGRTFAPSRDNIPEDFLFRAGGARSNRGYAYQSLGVQEGDAIVGGRFLSTGSIDYVHWLNDKWGAALFTDIGGAADVPGDLQGLKSYGIGARYRTPAGPLAVDLAYASRDHKFRLAFSVTVAF
ncbi:MAG: autotransporter assembly complex protein TamA [Usitatibacter sp.]